MSFLSFFVTTVQLSPVQPPGAGWTDLASIISALVRVMLIVAALATFFYLIIGGIQWITSGGDAKKTEAAGKQITNALIGLGIVAAAWAFMRIIEIFFNIEIISGIKIPKPQ
jgi:hypothetical protein